MYRRDSNLERQEELLWETLSLRKQYMKNANTSPDFTLIVIPQGTWRAFTEILGCVSSEDLDEDYFLSSCVPGLCPAVMYWDILEPLTGHQNIIKAACGMWPWLIDIKNSLLIIWPCCLIFPLSKKELCYSVFFFFQADYKSFGVICIDFYIFSLPLLFPSLSSFFTPYDMIP